MRTRRSLIAEETCTPKMISVALNKNHLLDDQLNIITISRANIVMSRPNSSPLAYGLSQL